MQIKNPVIHALEQVIFNIKYLLNLFYFGLIIVLIMYAYTYVKEILHLVMHINSVTTDEIKLAILEIVDIVMIANLVKMIITGSYNSFVSKDHGFKNENISSGMLKIKVSTSIVIVASIHLLQSFVAPTIEWNIIYKQLIIYGAFLLGSLILGILEFIHVKSEVLEHAIHKNSGH